MSHMINFFAMGDSLIIEFEKMNFEVVTKGMTDIMLHTKVVTPDLFDEI